MADLGSEMRIPIEELDLSIRAYNALKSCDVDFVDEIRPFIDSMDHPLAPKNPNLLRVRGEILEKLRGRDDDDGAGILSRL
jgi:Bacterial RNA polymerase, alpha chain C terminal domain